MQYFLSTDSFKNRLLAEGLENHQTWYQKEQGRYLCVTGRSYSNTTFSWKSEDSELMFMDLKLPDGNKCDLKGGCDQVCLRTLVPQLIPADGLGPRAVVLKYSACPIDGAVQDTEFFEYISILLFGEISAANEGNYSFGITGHFGLFADIGGTSKTYITVAKAGIVSRIKLIAGNLSNPRELLLKRQQSYLIQCLTDHADFNTTPQWFKGTEPIEKLVISGPVSDACHNATLNVFYIVKTNESTTSNYNDSYSLVTVYSSNARLYLCNVTEAMEGNYSCNISTDHVTRSVRVMLQSLSPSPGEDSSNTETLLIIWFAVLNGVLIIAILITLVVWCWMKCSVNKPKNLHSADDVGLPAFLHNYLEAETSFTDGDDPLEFPFSQLRFLHLLGLYDECPVEPVNLGWSLFGPFFTSSAVVFLCGIKLY